MVKKSKEFDNDKTKPPDVYVQFIHSYKTY